MLFHFDASRANIEIDAVLRLDSGMSACHLKAHAGVTM